MLLSKLPADRGSYLLILFLQVEQKVQIGRMGELLFPSGFYIYSGSALGAGGIKARLGRHLTSLHKQHWHIDYLLKYAIPVKYGWIIQARPRECDWIEILAACPDVAFPVHGFGASDCRRGCPAHLVHFGNRRGIDDALASIITAEEVRHEHIHFEMLDNPITLC